MTITAKVIKDSINPWGKRITTFELEYPRLVHSEFMTHRVFSRNAASSRAIPIKSVIQQVKDNPAMPFKWGKNQAGMQAKEELNDYQQEQAKALWLAARDAAVGYATAMSDLGLHKQVVNRVLEPFQHIKVVMTTTEYENWKWLRLHTDADPTIHELARVMEVARNNSIAHKLSEGMWHLPYVNSHTSEGVQYFWTDDLIPLSLEQAQRISCSSCAQVSYRKLDTSLEKADDIYKKLVESEPVHASAFEHVAMAFDSQQELDADGLTAIKSAPCGFGDIDTFDELIPLLVSGNFTGGWIQYRQLIPNNSKN